MKTRILLVAVVLGVLGVLGATCVQAGSGAGAILYSFNTSARFEGMGGAGVGTPWGPATNHWANPAQLAYRRGVQWEWYKSELAQGLADDIALENNEFIVGVGGITVLWGRTPAGGLFLDMGTQTATDENGNPMGSFSSYMESTSYGLAVDAIQVFDFFNSKSDKPLGLSRYGSLSFGYVHKDFEDMLSMDSVIQDPVGGGTATAKTYDLGWVLGVTPLNTLEEDESLVFLLGMAYGMSTLNGGDEVITHMDADQSDPLPRAYVKGYSLRGELALGREDWRRSMPEFLGWTYDTFNPLLSITYAYQKSQPGYVWDPQREEYSYEKDTSGNQDEIGSGYEIGLANIFYIRSGHFEATYADIDADTEGWGINIQAGDMLGFRYDKATFPQASGLPTVDRETWSIWFMPLAFCSD